MDCIFNFLTNRIFQRLGDGGIGGLVTVPSRTGKSSHHNEPFNVQINKTYRTILRAYARDGNKSKESCVIS